jgi:hypothetical protein
MTVVQFEELSLTLGITLLIGFMLFIVYDLAKKSGAGRFGTLVLFLGLGLGLVGFGAKQIIQLVMHV